MELTLIVLLVMLAVLAILGVIDFIRITKLEIEEIIVSRNKRYKQIKVNRK